MSDDFSTRGSYIAWENLFSGLLCRPRLYLSEAEEAFSCDVLTEAARENEADKGIR